MNSYDFPASNKHLLQFESKNNRFITHHSKAKFYFRCILLPRKERHENHFLPQIKFILFVNSMSSNESLRLTQHLRAEKNGSVAETWHKAYLTSCYL